MATNDEIPAELHVKICKKIAQLTKVIYTLNSKAEEQYIIIEKLREEHESDVQRIMHETKNKILKFKLQFQDVVEKEKQMKILNQMLNEMKNENSRLNNTLKEHVEKVLLNEKQLKGDYENKYLDLQNKLLERKRDYSELVHSFNSFKKEVENKKEQVITQLTIQHHEEIKQMSLSHKADIDAINDEKLHSQEKINDKMVEYESLQTQCELEKRELEIEYEAKISKLKRFYEKEIELMEPRKTNNEQQGKWEKEKSQLKNEFELMKSELNNCIRFLEKNNNENENKCEQLESRCQSLQSSLLSNQNVISSLENRLTEKVEEVDNLDVQLKEAHKKCKNVQEELACTVERKNADLQNIEALHEITKKQLDECRQQVHDLTANCASMKQKNDSLQRKCDQLMDEKASRRSIFSTLEKTVNDKNIDITSMEEKLEEMKERHAANIKQIEYRYANERNMERVKHAENIKIFKAQSEQILRDSQLKLLAEFEKSRGELTHQQAALIQTKDEQLKDIGEELKSSNECFAMITIQYNGCEDQLQKSLQSSMELKKKLDSVQKEENKYSDKCDAMDKLITSIKTEAINERSNLEKEKENLTKHLEAEKRRFEDEKQQLEKEWQNRISTELSAAQEELRQKYSKEKYELALISAQEKENWRFIKNQEILSLQKEVVNSKSVVDRLKTDASDQLRNHSNTLGQLKKSIDVDRTKLVQSFTTKLDDLQTGYATQKKQYEEKMEQGKKSALEELKHKHNLSISELHNVNVSSINALRSQLELEKEEALQLLKQQLSSEKEALQNFLRLQSEEKIQQFHNEHEEKVRCIKYELEQINKLRQKEFAVHTSKITELASIVEKEKTRTNNLNKQVNRLELETRELRKELELKVAEILEIRRDCNSRLRNHFDEMSHEHGMEIDDLKADHLRQMQALLSEWRDKQSEFEDQISALKLMLEEAEERFCNRPSRDDDIQIISELQQKILEQDIICQKLNEERKLYRLELVNREENFNKVFSSAPLVGFINPIEISKRKSAKKK